MAGHSALKSNDHLGEIIKRNGDGSIAGNIRLHETKCTKLLTNVLAPATKENLAEKLKGKKFPVLVNESHLTNLVPVSSTKGVILFEALENCLNNLGLALADCIGYGSDGASNMNGEHNSLWSRIRQHSPNCIEMRYVFHSLSLCIKIAFHKLPSNLGFLLKEIPKWLSKSSIRREGFKDLFQTMKPNDQRKDTPLPFTKYCTTGWLIRGKVLQNILMKWEELKAYFLVAEPASSQNARLEAKDDSRDAGSSNELLQPMQTQEESERQLHLHHKSLKFRVCDFHGNCKPVQNIDFGSKFILKAEKYIGSSSPTNDAKKNVMAIKERCVTFLKTDISEVGCRLPSAKNVFKGLGYFHPDNILSQTAHLPFHELPFAHLKLKMSMPLKSSTGKLNL
eukprot:gene9337-17040_t